MSTSWVNLIDSDMHVQIICIVMYNADSLMIIETKTIANLCLYFFQNDIVRLFTGRKTDN